MYWFIKDYHLIIIQRITRKISHGMINMFLMGFSLNNYYFYFVYLLRFNQEKDDEYNGELN